MKKNRSLLIVCATVALIPFSVSAKDTSHGAHGSVADNVIAAQRTSLAKSTNRIWSTVPTRH